MPGWLPLLNYSTKYNISLSTLRRRIKARTIEFKLDQGKYMILDEGTASAPEPKIQERPEPVKKRETSAVIGPVEASVLTSANRLVEEIKSAYSKILQEKEEQISQLKEEIVDLRMLVRIMEESSKKTPTPASKNIPAESSSPSSGDEFIFSDFQNREI